MTVKKKHSIFNIANELLNIDIDKIIIDSLDYRGILDSNKEYLLIAKDLNPWTERVGYGYYHYRSEAIYVKNGFAVNKPIYSFNTASTILECKYVEVNNNIHIKHLRVVRTSNISLFTLFKVENCTNVSFIDISVNTFGEKLNKEYDSLFNINNSANIYFEDIKTINKWSNISNPVNYSYELNTVSNVIFKNCSNGDSDWGVFGCNNINRVYLTNCDINRFDVHCYGKNFKFNNCRFYQFFNRFTGCYGSIIFDSCEFSLFRPCSSSEEYNCYTKYKVSFFNCIYTPKSEDGSNFNSNSLVTYSSINLATNTRQELSKKYLPDIEVDNLEVNTNSDSFFILETGTSFVDTGNKFKGFYGYTKMVLNNIKFPSSVKKVYTNHYKIQYLNCFSLELSNIDLLGEEYINGNVPSYIPWTNNYGIISPIINNNIGVFKATRCNIMFPNTDAVNFDYILSECKLANCKASTVSPKFNIINSMLFMNSKEVNGGSAINIPTNAKYTSCMFMFIDRSVRMSLGKGFFSAIFENCISNIKHLGTCCEWNDDITDTSVWQNVEAINNELIGCYVSRNSFNDSSYHVVDLVSIYRNGGFLTNEQQNIITPRITRRIGNTFYNLNPDGSKFGTVINVTKISNINSSNAIYPILDTLDLNGEIFTLPQNVTLDFSKGGKIINGEIVMSKTKIIPNGCSIEDYITATISGSYAKGQCLFDTELGKPKYWTGEKWVDATGIDV